MVPYDKDCGELLLPEQTFEVEPTTHPLVVYAKSGTAHIGYVPINVPVGSIGAGRFPAALLGIWLTSRSNCAKFARGGRDEYDSDDFMEITAEQFKGHESSARILAIRETRRGVWEANLHFDGEGTQWLSRLTFERDGDTLRIPGEGSIASRVLCTGRAGRQEPRGPRHSDFPARPYRGPIAMPDFQGRDRAHRTLRTRITDGMRAGPNAAGHIVIIPIGCGTACVFVSVGDVLTGRVTSFPMGGEDYPHLRLDHRIDSNLVIASWQDEAQRCRQASYVWTGAGFRSLSSPTVLGTDRCPDR